MGLALDEKTVRDVAQLARLDLSRAEVAMFARQLSQLLEYFEKLSELDTTDVPPMAHPLSLSNVFREDIVRPPWSTEDALNGAPDQHDGFFRVPKVLDREDG